MRQTIDEPIEIRRTGRTTRIANEYIETLFKNGEINDIKDHFDNVKSHQHLFHIIVKRLYSEHVFLKFDANKNNLSIKIEK